MQGLTYRQVAERIDKQISYVQRVMEYLRNNGLLYWGRWSPNVYRIGMRKSIAFLDWEDREVPEKVNFMYTTYVHYVQAESTKVFVVYTYPIEDHLENIWKERIVELIRWFFEMDFPAFESHYPEIVEILGLSENSFNELKDRTKKGEVGTRIEWSSDTFHRFIGKCIRLEQESEKGKILQELEKLQKELELECFEDPSKAGQLAHDFFGSSVIDSVSRNPERIMFFDISKRVPKKKILCLYYEDIKERFALNIYPRTVADEKNVKSTEEDREKEAPRFELLEIPRTKLQFERPTGLYASESIRQVIDMHVMPALHPPPVDICFPVDDFMLEVDPEEPEIGFLSRHITLEDSQTLEERLRIDTTLRDKLWIYRWEEDIRGKRFHSSSIENQKKGQEKDILILGRTENLYRVLNANKRYGLLYPLVDTFLKSLVFFTIIYLVLNILQDYGAHFSDATTTLLQVFVAFFSVIFIFWTLRIFVLNYILEPMYRMFRLSSYIFLAVVLSSNDRLVVILSTLLLAFAFICGILLFSKYICSAVIYNLNNLFEIIGHDDTLEIECSEDLNNEVNILKCGRFQTIVRRNNSVSVYFNSDFFPKIKWVHKKVRTLPRRAAYSSGVFFSLPDAEPQRLTDKEQVEEFLYRNPKTWGFWRTVERFLFSKGEIQAKDPEELSLSDRFVYIGEWKSVMKKISSTISLFPQITLFRNMIILVALSGLLFNTFRVHGISFTALTKWIETIDSWGIFLYFIIPVTWILLTRKLRIQLWKGLLILIFFLSLSIQEIPIILLAVLVLLVFLFLVKFPIQQVYYFFRIWLNDKRRGNLVSIVYQDKNIRGTRIKRNFLFTQVFINDSTYIEKKTIYFNKKFFEDVVLSDKWRRTRENLNSAR